MTDDVIERGTAPKAKHSGYERDEHDWYVEPAWCTELLCKHMEFDGPIHDPACGRGTIPEALAAAGYQSSGRDIVDRGWPALPPRDFLADKADCLNIVTNPPYKLAEAFARHALKHTRHKIAILVRLDFLASQRRHKLFTEHPPSLVLVLSRRPSMPPGWQDAPAKGGMHDFSWIVWNQDEFGLLTAMEWAK